MKIRSDAQRTILEMMREGWKLTRLCIQHPECDHTDSVQRVSIKALERKGLIVWTGEQYHLKSITEMHNVAPPSNSMASCPDNKKTPSKTKE